MALVEPCALLPVRTTVANPVIRITDTAGPAEDITVTMAVDTDYWNAGDDDATAGEADLIKILEDALNTNSYGATVTCTLNDRNLILIEFQMGGGDYPINILWSHVNTTFDPTLIGFTSVDTGLSGSIFGTDCTKGFWYPSTPSRTAHVREDTRTEPVTVGYLAETIDGQSRGYELTSSLGERNISFHLIEREKILVEYARADEPYNSLEYFWKTSGMAAGWPIRWYNDTATRTTSSYEKFRTKTRDRPWRKMDVGYINRYEVFFALRERS